MCFRRVMWGQAAHLLYAHTRLKLGRLASDFARNHLRHFYDMSVPIAFASTGRQPDTRVSSADTSLISGEPSANTSSAITISSNQSSDSSQNSSVPGRNTDGSPLRVVLFSRGGDGYGRTLMNEQHIVDHMNTLPGVIATMCCDFKTVSFDKQLAIAYHADVVCKIRTILIYLCIYIFYSLFSSYR